MADLTAVWRIICDAKRIMAANGRNQWTEEYPSQAVGSLPGRMPSYIGWPWAPRSVAVGLPAG